MSVTMTLSDIPNSGFKVTKSNISKIVHLRDKITIKNTNRKPYTVSNDTTLNDLD